MFHPSDWPKKKVIMCFTARLGSSHSHALLVGVSVGTTPMEGNLSLSTRSTNLRVLDLAAPLLGLCPVVAFVLAFVKDACAVLFIAALCTIATMGNNLNALNE